MPLVLRMALAGLSCLLVLSCTAIRPVAKIGLLAPFEGLYRRTGYNALAAMRAALADAPPASPDLLPLALDSSVDPVRATQKLLADPLLAGLVGPFSLKSVDAIEPLLTSGGEPWFVPFAVEPAGGFAMPGQVGEWMTPLLEKASQAAQRAGCRRLVIAGWPATWPTESLTAIGARTGLTVAQVDDAAQVQVDDAVLHLGEADAAAIFANHLPDTGRRPPFFLGLQGDDPVFAEHSQSVEGIAWLAWVDDAYPAWASGQEVASPSVYQVYRAAATAMAMITGRPQADPSPWQLQWFVYDSTGHAQRAEWPPATGCAVTQPD